MCRRKHVFMMALLFVGLITAYVGFNERHSEFIKNIVQQRQRTQSLHSKDISPPLFEKAELERVTTREDTAISPAVILLTYMRSGSSMTGDILQRSPDVFYVFEPLWALMIAERDKSNITFLNGTVLRPGTYNQTAVYMADLTGWLTCNIKQITMQSLFSQFMRFGKKTESSWRCLMSKTKVKLKCIQTLLKECKQAKVKVVKTLRISMKSARVVLGDIAGSKVIHLLRDPRATLQSRKLLDPDCRGDFQGTNGKCAKEHCHSVWNNTRDLNSFPVELRNRVVTVRYEDIVISPLESAELLYKFIGLGFTPDVREFVYNITVAGKIGQCEVCNQHWQAGRNPGENSSSHITLWKKQITLTELFEVQRACKDTIVYYDYKLYDVDN